MIIEDEIHSNQNAMNKVIENIKRNLFTNAQAHDYSYMMSDSNDVWDRGNEAESRIYSDIHILCGVHKEDAEALMNELLTTIPEQYTDGLTHRVIRSWFSRYIAS